MKTTRSTSTTRSFIILMLAVILFVGPRMGCGAISASAQGVAPTETPVPTWPINQAMTALIGWDDTATPTDTPTAATITPMANSTGWSIEALAKMGFWIFAALCFLGAAFMLRGGEAKNKK